MKKFCMLPLMATLAFFVSCQKQQTEGEKKAEAERQVQERLAAEQQAAEKQRFDARQKQALEEKAAANAPAVSTVTPAASPAP